MIDSPADVVVVVAMASRGAETLLVSQREREKKRRQCLPAEFELDGSDIKGRNVRHTHCA